jgi:Nickel responsive protein SCO4226-like
MPRYIIERSVPGLSRDELMAAGRRSVAALQFVPGVRWIRSYVSDTEGKIYCEYDAPSPEAIREHARRAGLPVDRISEIALEIEPSMFV